MARPTDPKSERSLAAKLEQQLGEPFSRKRIQVMKKAGVDFDDLESVKKYLRNSQRAGRAETAPETASTVPAITAENIDAQIEELREHLLAASEKRDAETIDIKIRGLSRIQGMLREQGKYILAADAETEGMRFGLAAKHMWEEIEDSLPPMLEGLSALQMKTKLREFAAARILELHEFFPG